MQAKFVLFIYRYRQPSLNSRSKAGIPPGKSDASGGIGPKTLMLK